MRIEWIMGIFNEAGFHGSIKYSAGTLSASFCNYLKFHRRKRRKMLHGRGLPLYTCNMSKDAPVLGGYHFQGHG